MTQDLLTDLGEEYLMKNGLDGITVNVGVYNDNTDGLSDSDDHTAIGTEPSNGNYSKKSATFSASDLSGNWGVDNDSQFVFDFSDQTSSETVDTAFVTYSFQAADTNDGSSTEHMLANPALTQDRDIGSIDELRIDPGDLQITVN